MRLLVIFTACFAVGAWAQTYPSKPIHVIVPFAAGGGVDTIARTMMPKVSDGLGQPILLDNRPGAGANIGADLVAKATPDGYTYLITPHGLAISPSLYRKLPFDAAKDFAAVTQISSSYLVFVSSTRLPAASLREFIALAKSQPGRMNYGSTGNGAPPHLAGELLKMLAGINIVHVPYKGDALMYTAMLGGEIDVAFGPLAGAMPHIKSGKMRALGMTGERRAAVIPEVPTMVEAGVPNFVLPGWLGIFAPAGTPRAAIERMQAEVAKAIAKQELREKMLGWGYEPVGSTPEEFDARFKSDLALYAHIVQEAHIPPQE
jgi:tripartite-type tricarboxylate transporter receptor subunit TctC